MINKLKKSLVHFKTTFIDLKTNEECTESTCIKYDNTVDCAKDKFMGLKFEITNKCGKVLLLFNFIFI